MKIYSKKIEVSDRKINATFTKEMYDDIKNMKSFDQVMLEYEREFKREVRRQKIRKINGKIDSE